MTTLVKTSAFESDVEGQTQPGLTSTALIDQLPWRWPRMLGLTPKESSELVRSLLKARWALLLGGLQSNALFMAGGSCSNPKRCTVHIRLLPKARCALQYVVGHVHAAALWKERAIRLLAWGLF